MSAITDATDLASLGRAAVIGHQRAAGGLELDGVMVDPGRADLHLDARRRSEPGTGRGQGDGRQVARPCRCFAPVGGDPDGAVALPAPGQPAGVEPPRIVLRITTAEAGAHGIAR